MYVADDIIDPGKIVGDIANSLSTPCTIVSKVLFVVPKIVVRLVRTDTFLPLHQF